MKKLLLNWMTIMVVAIISVGIASCSGSDEDDGVVSPSESGTSATVPDPEGTVVVNMSAASNSKSHYIGFSYSFRIDEDSNFYSAYGGITFASVGLVKGLSEIKSIPTFGWAEEVAVIPGYGYVVRSDYDNKYARIYVVCSTGNGYTVKYQSPFIP